MDLFSLVAKLTLDDSAYESAIQSAEGKGKNAKLNASGDIKAEDKYSEEIGKAKKQVDDFDKKEATADIKVDTEDATKNTTSFEGVFRESVGKMGAALTAAGIAMGVKKIAEEFAAALEAASEYADVVDKGSRELSMSTQAYQEWRYALQASGADIGTITKGWKSLTNIVTDGSLENASEDIQGAFNALQIDPSQYKTTEALFDAVIDGLASMEAGSERDSLVNAIFGPGGTKLNALLDSGVSGIDALIKRAHELKLVMSESDVANGTAYGDAINDMNLAVDALKQNIVSNLFPVLTDMANTIAGVVAFFNGRADADTLTQQFEKINQHLHTSFFEIGKDEAVTGSLIAELKTMSDETGKCKDNLTKWQEVAGKLIELCPGLKSQIDLVTGSFTEQTGSLEDNAAAWFKNARAQAIQKAVQDKSNALAAQAGKVAELEVSVVQMEAEMAYNRQEAIRRIFEKVQESGSDAQKGKYTEEYLNSLADYDLYKLLDKGHDLYHLMGGSGNLNRLQIQGMLKENFYLGEGGLPEKIAKAKEEAEKLRKEYEKMAVEYQKYIDAVEEYMNRTEGGEASGTEESAEGATETVEGLSEAIEDLPDEKTVTINVETNGIPGAVLPEIDYGDFGKFGGFAKGLPSVPYDNFIANLHRDEMVLTASQARRYREGGNDNAELAAAIRELRADMTNLQIVVGQKTFGRTVVKYGGKRLGGYLGGAEDRVAAGYGWG